MMTELEMWRKIILENLNRYACKNDEAFNFWLGFHSGLENGIRIGKSENSD